MQPANTTPHHTRDSIQQQPIINLNSQSITSGLSQNPSRSPKQLKKKLYPKPFVLKRIWLRFIIKENLYSYQIHPNPHQIHLARLSGIWSSKPTTALDPPPRPSELFLKMFSDVLLCLERDQLAGVVSPSLIATCGVIPLTILSVIPHIIQHYYDCIVLAEHEVLIATNYLQKSDSQRKICQALVELSKRVGERQQKNKVVVKLIYDRGNWRQVFKNHLVVKPNSKAWRQVGLPDLKDIPNLEFEAVNFHRVLLGTFHSKFLIVDRKVALLNSNNIQDRPNLEMMIHLEGPIVDSFYDTFLISWSTRLNPPLPLLSQSPTGSKPIEYPFGFSNPYLRNIDVVQSAQDARAMLHREAESDRNAQPNPHHYDGILTATFANVVRDLMEDRWRSRQQQLQSSENLHRSQDPPLLTTRSHSNRLSNAVQMVMEDIKKSKSVTHVSFTHNPSQPSVRHSDRSNSEDLTIDQRATTSSPTNTADSSTTTNPSHGPESNLLARSLLVDSRSKNSHDHVALHPRPGIDSSSQAPHANSPNPLDSSTPHTISSRSKSRMRALSDALNAGTLRQTEANVSSDHEIGDFEPHTIHRKHEEFPIVMVNRPPHGFPGHNDIRVPQNAAWMAGFKYAEKKIFIQTPTLNSFPVVKMCIETAKRGVQVILYLDLGFNDKGESIPFQGGTNQEVIIKMYQALQKSNSQKNLMVYWYTGKDQIRPINAVLKSRNCHVKFMAIDDRVAIQGNGNQDTQSWFHSQEINVMIDSPQIVQDWMKALISNQNTQLYGQVHPDGIWRDLDGHTVDYYDQPHLTNKKKNRKSHEQIMVETGTGAISAPAPGGGTIKRRTKSELVPTARISSGSSDVVETREVPTN